MSQALDHSILENAPGPGHGGAASNNAPTAAGLTPDRFRLELLLLWLAALALLLTGLNGPPLRDWDEGIVARVALELSRLPWPERLWPTYWGEPYLNKPPGLHLLVAAAIDAWEALRGVRPAALSSGALWSAALPPAWLLRLVPALISSLLVPLLALLQWRLRPGDRLTALLTGAIALTLLPLTRHGHLLMLDGCQLVAMVLLWWALLGPGDGPAHLLRRNPAHGPSTVLPDAQQGREAASGLSIDQPERLQNPPGNRAHSGANHLGGGLSSGLVAGLATSALLLLKAPAALPVLAGTLLLRLLERDLSRRRWAVLAVGLALGLLPGLAWHGGHLLVRGDAALQMWLGQGFARVGSALEGNSGGPLTPVLEVLEGGWPWLPLWPFGLALAWRQRRNRAGLWCLGLTVLTAAMVLPLRTQLPWYSLLLWPPFALVCAPVLAWLVRRDRLGRPPGAGVVARIPRLWSLLGVLLLAAGLLAGVLAMAPGSSSAVSLSSGDRSAWVQPQPEAARQTVAPGLQRDTAVLPGLPGMAAGTGSLPSSARPSTPPPREQAVPEQAARDASPRQLAASALSLGAGLLTGGLLLSADSSGRRRQGLVLLLLGDGLALLLLFASPLWLWELNENWPVADGLALLQGNGAGRDGGEVRLWRQGERPSLSWTFGQRIRPEDNVNLDPGQSVWLLGLESAQAPGLDCQMLGRRGELRLERCRAAQPTQRTPSP